MKKRRMLAGLLAAVMLATTLPQAFAAPQQTAYATRGQVVEMLLAAADDYNPGLKKEDIIQGNGDGDLREDELVTRAEAMTMLSRAFGQLPTPMGDALRTGLAKTTFTDVPQWASEEVAALSAAGILAGTGDGRLSPLDNVTVEQMEWMIRRVWALEGSNRRDDFYATVNHDWLVNSTIPSGEISNGAMNEMTASNNEKVEQIVRQAAQGNSQPGSVQQKIGDFYKGVLAVKKGQVNDLSPLQPYLDAVDQVQNMKDVVALRNRVKEELGLSLLCTFGLTVDLKNSDRYMLTFSGASADLTADYFSAGGQAMEAYRQTLAALLQLAGESAEQAQQDAGRIYAMEEALAKASMKVEDAGNIDKVYNVYTMDQLRQAAPNMGLDQVLQVDGLKQADQILVTDPGLLAANAAYWTDEQVDTLKALMKLSLIQGLGAAMSADVDQVNTEFQQVFFGAEGGKEPEEAASLVTQQVMGDYVGQIYVEEYFSEEAKADVTQMVEEFIEVYKKRLEDLDWMSQATKDKAIEKLDAMTLKIGYPDQWDDSMDGVEITDDYYQNTVNLLKAGNAQVARMQDQPVDKSGWMMTVYTVNAYYNAGNNEIVFPAGILQAPFYDKDASREENLGGIGFVIAHEITHSFDNNGAKFDAQGNATDWWQPGDYEHFQQLCGEVEAFYDGVEVAPGFVNNGTRTLSENIADLGSMACILETARLEGDPDYQALFENLAKCWTMTSSRSTLQLLASVDVHSFNKVRVNRTLQNFEEFYQTYGIQEGDGMYVAPADRVQIW